MKVKGDWLQDDTVVVVDVKDGFKKWEGIWNYIDAAIYREIVGV